VWHSDNDKIDVSNFVQEAEKTYAKDPAAVYRVVYALNGVLDKDLQSAALNPSNRDDVRQISENLAYMMLGIAKFHAAEPEAAKMFVDKAGPTLRSANDLIRIARENGSNPHNVAQMEETADRIERAAP